MGEGRTFLAESEPLLYTRKQTSRVLQISLGALDKLYRLRQGPRCLVIAGRRLYPRMALEQFISEQLAHTERTLESEARAGL